eukprot:2276138-Rhodomonas_salina.1
MSLYSAQLDVARPDVDGFDTGSEAWRRTRSWRGSTTWPSRTPSSSPKSPGPAERWERKNEREIKRKGVSGRIESGEEDVTRREVGWVKEGWRGRGSTERGAAGG